MLTDEMILEVMRLTAFEYTTSVFWRFDDGRLRLFIDCSDTFDWASADAEEVTPDNLETLRQAMADCDKADPKRHCLADTLFCCRSRNKLPMQEWFDVWKGNDHTAELDLIRAVKAAQ